MASSSPPEPPPKPASIGHNGKVTPAAFKPLATVRTAPVAADSDASFTGDQQDPGDEWLPDFILQRLESISTETLTELLADSKMLNDLTYAPQTMHPSLTASSVHLQKALSDNAYLSSRLLSLEDQVKHHRAIIRTQLLATHALERQWIQKQSDMDITLKPFSPASLYSNLSHGLQDQLRICQAIEDSFLNDRDRGADDRAFSGERETQDWIRDYREAKRLAYLRMERRNRWDEGRVGGWPQTL